MNLLVIKSNEIVNYIYTEVEENVSKEMVFNTIMESSKTTDLNNTFKEFVNGHEARFKIIQSGSDERIYFSFNKKLTNSSSTFNRMVQVAEDFSDKSKNEVVRNKETNDNSLKILRHNISKHLAHITQELTYVLPPEHRNHKRISDIEHYIGDNLNSTAKALKKIQIRSNHIESEISIFNFLNNEDPGKLYIKSHQIHRVLAIYSYLFFEEFTSANIVLEILKSEEYGLFDYNSMAAAFFHFFFNASKYCQSESKIIVKCTSENEVLLIDFEMISLRIHPDEISKIFEKGARGKEAVDFEDGDGIGLFAISKILKMNHGSFEIIPSLDAYKKYKNRIYSKNRFIFKIPLSKRR